MGETLEERLRLDQGLPVGIQPVLGLEEQAKSEIERQALAPALRGQLRQVRSGTSGAPRNESRRA